MDIGFNSISKELGPAIGDAVYRLSTWIPEAIARDYRERFSPANILTIKTFGFTYLFDLASECASRRDDRVICVYGLSQPQSGPRDAARMKGFLGGGLVISGTRYDKGHLASHGQGGFEDGLNLFPQRPDINRGHKCADPRYREMERYCSDNPGTFFFSRVIYDDDTWVPAEVEYGILKAPYQLEVQRFPN